MKNQGSSSSDSSESSTSRSRSREDRGNNRNQGARPNVSYQQYLENRREKRLAIRKNYIWDIHSDDETFQTQQKEMNAQRRRERQVIDEITRREEDLIRKQKLELIKKGEHLQQVMQPKPQPNESLVAQKLKEQQQEKILENENSESESSNTSNSNSEDESDQSFAEQVKRINEELKQKRGEQDGSQIIGPMPLIIDNLNHRVNYGKELLPGEGAAIAYYIQNGQRIPRRGEVGLSSDDIQKYEDTGYVMSGTKHKKINQVRQRKEQIIYDAEQKKALMIFRYEQKIKREKQILDELQTQLKGKIKLTKMS